MTKAQALVWASTIMPYSVWVYHNAAFTPPHKVLMLCYGVLFLLNGYNVSLQKLLPGQRANSAIGLVFAAATLGLLYFGLSPIFRG